MAQYHWRDADRLTFKAFVASAYSKDLYFSYENISCGRLKEIDTLWFDNSAGRFGFSVQKDIYEATGNVPGQYNEESYILFAHEVGWNRIKGNIEDFESALDEQVAWLSYNELLWSEGMGGRELLDSRIPPPLGHLPCSTGLGEGRKGFCGWGGGSPLALRISTCNI